MVRTSCDKYLKLVNGLLCCKSPAESAEMRWTYVILHANDMYGCGSETEMSRRLWIQTIIHGNGILAAKNDCIDLMPNC